MPEQKMGAGFDLYSDEAVTIRPDSLWLVDLGVASSFKGGVIIFKDRSGVALKGVEVHAGVIDPEYRGEWRVLLKNASHCDVRIEVGDRIAQALPFVTPTIFFDEVATLDETERGDGAFGSTGR